MKKALLSTALLLAASSAFAGGCGRLTPIGHFNYHTENDVGRLSFGKAFSYTKKSYVKSGAVVESGTYAIAKDCSAILTKASNPNYAVAKSDDDSDDNKAKTLTIWLDNIVQINGFAFANSGSFKGGAISRILSK